MEELNFNPICEDIRNTDPDFPPGISSAVFFSEGLKLLGTVFMADGKGPHPTVLLLHGFPGNENNFDIAQTLRRAGYNTVFFHYRGIWGSPGKFSFSNCIEDTANVIREIQSLPEDNQYRIDSRNIIIAGHSMGGFCAMITGAQFPEIKKIAFLAGFNFGYFSKLMLKNEEFAAITKQSISETENYIGTFETNNLYDEMINNRKEWDIIKHIPQYAGKNILLVGSKNDSVSPLAYHHIPLVNSFKEAGITITDRILDSGHSFSNKRIELQKIFIDWINKD